jgi:hypothetical protein
MDRAVECTHCQVTMTSWSAPGSPIRYYQCPFCARTHASCYGEVFSRRAGARLVGAASRTASRASEPSGMPRASDDDIRWAGVKARAARWFARLEAEELRATTCATRAVPLAQPAEASAAAVSLRPARHR